MTYANYYIFAWQLRGFMSCSQPKQRTCFLNGTAQLQGSNKVQFMCPKSHKIMDKDFDKHKTRQPVALQDSASFRWKVAVVATDQKNKNTPAEEWKSRWIPLPAVSHWWKSLEESHMSEYMHQSCHTSGCGVMVCGGGFSGAHIWTRDRSKAMVDCHRTAEHYCQSGISVTAWKHWKHSCRRTFFSGAMLNATQTELSTNAPWAWQQIQHAAVDLPSHKISVQLGICRMKLEILEESTSTLLDVTVGGSEDNIGQHPCEILLTWCIQSIYLANRQRVEDKIGCKSNLR